MNPSRLSLFLLLAASCSFASASGPVAPAAQPTPAPAAQSHPHPTAKPAMDLDRMFATADADKNGSISRAEFGNYHAAMHKAHSEAGDHAGCMPMEHATASEADDAPKADAGK